MNNASPSGKERREHLRAQGPFDGSWGGESGRRSGRIWDVSVTGCYVDGWNAQHTGETVEMENRFGEGRVEAQGQVVYSLPNLGFAVRLTEVSAQSMAILQQALRRLLGVEPPL